MIRKVNVIFQIRVILSEIIRNLKGEVSEIIPFQKYSIDFILQQIIHACIKGFMDCERCKDFTRRVSFSFSK